MQAFQPGKQSPDPVLSFLIVQPGKKTKDEAVIPAICFSLIKI